MNGGALRNDYLDILDKYRGTGVIKFIVGVRYCGKTALLDRFEELLKDDGVDEARIFRADFSRFSGKNADRGVLERRLRELPDDECYVLLDEVQSLEGWELAVAALAEYRNRDVYIACSRFDVADDLATYLAGRYILVPVYPLSFQEYLELHPGDAEERFSEYMQSGGLPLAAFSEDEAFSSGYARGVFYSVLLMDVLGRMGADGVDKAVAIATFLYSHAGESISMASVAEGAKVSGTTAEKYIRAMAKAFLFHRVEKYDIAKGRVLKTNGRFYASDTGMMYGCGGQDPDRLIENVVCLELMRRGYVVRTGSYRGKDVDFIAIKGDEVEYYQVTQTMLSEETRERELGSLRPIKDNFPKTILTLDRLGLGTEMGIRIVNLYDWLLSRCPRGIRQMNIFYVNHKIFIL